MRALRPVGGTRRHSSLPGSPLLLGFLMLCAAAVATLPLATHAQDLSPREQPYEIPAQGLAEALITYSDQSGVQVVTSGYDLVDRETAGITGTYTAAAALDALLSGSGMEYTVVGESTVALTDPNAPPMTLAPVDPGGAAGEGAGGFGDGNATSVAEARRAGVEEIIVTGQKKEERIQDVPIAISAFSMEQLDAQKIEGGFDLLKAIPNVSFSKTNFTSYNFQIRGVGTQSISATSDPGAAVSFNNVAIIQNRLFEQEYLDVERVEVLRGPQGTLYGRNATAGVINVISNKPKMSTWEGMLDLEIGNYQTQRLRGHFNAPLGDTFAIRGAYAATERDGYTYNAGTDSDVDGRNLWTGRISLGWQPNDRIRADLIYERFYEEDDRLRTGKQLCHRDEGPETLGSVHIETGVPLDPSFVGREEAVALRRAAFGQGCEPGSLYADGAYDTPNGLSYNFVYGSRFGPDVGNRLGENPDGTYAQILTGANPYGDLRQSPDLREIYSPRDPVYRAEADLYQLNVDLDLTDTLTVSSQTAYVDDETYSFQDFNRFASLPIFTDTDDLVVSPFIGDFREFSPGGVFCDPQVGCSETLAGFDIAQAAAEQFSQELRIQSAFDGPVNFSFGANYTNFDVLVDYYIMFNVISAMASSPLFDGHPDPDICRNGWAWDGVVERPADDIFAHCPYVDPNPVDTSRNFGTGGNGEGEGHNYYRSKNPYELESWAGFGEIYWNIRDDLKLTAGLRYTKDTKTFTEIPTQTLLASGFLGGGTVARGYPVAGVIEQEWGEWTGRLVLDWQPVLDFTDESVLYVSFSRGYKGGGANPPKPGFADKAYINDFVVPDIIDQATFDFFDATGAFPVLQLTADEYSDTFEPEFVNGFEIGTKNTLFGGAVMLNATAFYYDYTDYQVSQIRDRTAVNENFDADIWGLELETVFAPSEHWQFLANVGYLKTRIADGETSIDIINRTQGDPGYVLVKPWSQLPSNCIIPVHVAENWAATTGGNGYMAGAQKFCGGLGGFLAIATPTDDAIDPMTGEQWDPLAVNGDGNLLYPEINGGAGLLADLGGNELPQSPNFTVTVGGQYNFDVLREWRSTVRMDYYWQGDSYHRVYNLEPYDRLQSWSNINFSMWVTNERQGVTIEAYVKNLLNDDPITGAFLNSDDTGLTTNVFVFDPRLIGLSIKKEF